MNGLRIDPHLNPKSDSLELHPAAIVLPLNPPKKGTELARDLVNSRFEVAARFFSRPTVLKRQVD
jgi:hypothetical protein